MNRCVTRVAIVVFAIAAFVALSVPSFADGSSTEKATTEKSKDLSFRGEITGIDMTAHTVRVKQVLESKTFNISDGCKVSTYDVANDDTKAAALGDLKVGMEVKVSYQSQNGAFNASRITQEGTKFTGEIAAVNVPAHTVSVKKMMDTKTFNIADNCRMITYDFASNEKKESKLDDLKVGTRVSVGYDTVNGVLMARRIGQEVSTFSGRITSLNVPAHTLTVKKMLETRTFNVGDGSTIVTADKPQAKLDDLKVGSAVTVSYSDVDGALMAGRIDQSSNATAKVEKSAR